MLDIVTFSVCCITMLSVAVLSVIMLGVVILCHYSEFLYALHNGLITTLCRMLFCVYGKFGYSEHHYSECHYAV